MRNIWNTFRQRFSKWHNAENWAFEIVSYKRLNRDFLFILNNVLAKESLKLSNPSTKSEIGVFIEKIEELAQTSLKEALVMNARTIKRLK